MDNMYYIGDVHGKISEYIHITEQLPKTIQLGDMGVGFSDVCLPALSTRHRWIHGNHDNPDLCVAHPNHLGYFGFIPDEDIFYVSGGYSIDRYYRIEGVSWWRNEELNYEQWNKCFALYKETHPSIVVSHDCPKNVYSMVMPSRNLQIPNATSNALSLMFSEWHPRLWVFAHHHISKTFDVDKTSFVALGELAVYSEEMGIQ